MQRALTLAVTEQQRQKPELVNELPAALFEIDAKRVARAADEWLRPARRAVLELVPGAGWGRMTAVLLPEVPSVDPEAAQDAVGGERAADVGP